MLPTDQPEPARRRLVAVQIAAMALLSAILIVVPAGASLQGRVDAGRARERALRSGIHADTVTIRGFDARVGQLRGQLSLVQGRLSTDDALLSQLQSQLARARGQLASLRRQLVTDRRLLAAQLVGQYESPPPDITTVLFQAHGFSQLLERVDQLRQIARQNADVTQRVGREQRVVAGQAAHLAVLEDHQQRITSKVVAQRDEVAHLELSVVQEQLTYAHSRARKAQALSTLSARQRTLEGRLRALQAQEAARTASASASLPAGSGYSGGGFSSHGGDYGFFPAAGTDYGVGDEPQITARLDVMGKALHLHLIGVSGYRSPSHSMEVGGFANDPHTRGQASDTPGVEGVPEATLERFGLTRPFPGAAEADHVQLLGSPL